MASRNRHAVLIHSRCIFYSVMPAFMPWNNSAQLPARLTSSRRGRVSWNRAVSWFEPCSGIGTDRQTHYKHRTFAQFARRRHIATHHARELAGDGEAETGAAEALRGRGISLAEFLEQLCLLLRRHADAAVGHGKLDPVAFVNHPSRSQRDFALFGELARIAQQVEQYLPQPHGVHSQCAEVLLGIDDEAVLVLLGKLTGGADDLIDKSYQINMLGIEFELAGLDLREVEYLVDEAQEVSTGGIHAAQRFQRLFRAEARRVADHHLGEPDDGVQRRAHSPPPAAGSCPGFPLTAGRSQLRFQPG